MKVAAIQHDIAWEDAAVNRLALAPKIAEAASDGAGLVVLAEMFPTGFTMAPESCAEPPDGESTQFLLGQAAQHEIWVTGSIATRAPGADRAKNTLTLAGPSGELHRYAKIHPFTYASEDRHYEAGEEFLTVEINGVRCTFFICYDLRFADEFWTTAADTDCYVIPANWPSPRRQHWTSLLRARAIENQAFVVGVNRVGGGDGLQYVGDSQIISPLGEILADGQDRETTITADVTAEAVSEVRAKFPFMADRR